MMMLHVIIKGLFYWILEVEVCKGDNVLVSIELLFICVLTVK